MSSILKEALVDLIICLTDCFSRKILLMGIVGTQLILFKAVDIL